MMAGMKLPPLGPLCLLLTLQPFATCQDEDRFRTDRTSKVQLELPGFALDVDRPDDLTAFAAQPSATAAYEYLRREELLGRLAH